MNEKLEQSNPIENEEEEEVSITDSTLVKSRSIDEQSWKPLAYLGVATVLGSALLFTLVYMRR